MNKMIELSMHRLDQAFITNWYFGIFEEAILNYCLGITDRILIKIDNGVPTELIDKYRDAGWVINVDNKINTIELTYYDDASEVSVNGFQLTNPRMAKLIADSMLDEDWYNGIIDRLISEIDIESNISVIKVPYYEFEIKRLVLSEDDKAITCSGTNFRIKAITHTLSKYGIKVINNESNRLLTIICDMYEFKAKKGITNV